jgi:hypothetical protein
MRRASQILAGLVVVLLLPIAHAGAAARPMWSASSVALPTYFVPGDTANPYGYELLFDNSGAASTAGGTLSIVDELPPGLAVKSVELPLRESGNVVDQGPTLCDTETSAEVSTVRCTIPEELPDGSDPAVLLPYEAIRMVIRVSVPANAPEGEIANRVSIRGGGSPVAEATDKNLISSARVPAGFQQFRSALTDEEGRPVSTAGAHPYQYTTGFAVNTKTAVPASEGAFEAAGGDVKNIEVALPPGLIGNPTAVSQCPTQKFNEVSTIGGVTSYEANACPAGSVLGLVIPQQIEGEGGAFTVPLYNLVPPQGMPAQFGFQVAGLPFFINTKVRTGGDYGITAYLKNLSEAKRVTAATVFIWGTPAAAGHDPFRGACLSSNEKGSISAGSCPAGIGPKTFMRLPTSCGGPLTTSMNFNSWSNPGFAASEEAISSPVGGCGALSFRPTFTAMPSVTVADSPTGLGVNIHLPQQESAGLAEADLRNAVVTLPRGVTINPSSGAGLAGCSPAQIEINGPNPATCPDASKVGSVEVITPLLDHPIKGGVFVATQNENPFDSLVAIYIAAYDPATGVVLKLAGHVEPDPVTGQLTARFENNPQLPFEDLDVNFFDGPRAALRTPTTCGQYTTATVLLPWSAPLSGAAVTPSDAFSVTTAPGGGACASSEAAQPNHPSFSAGTVTPLAAESSPLVVHIERADGSQNLGGLNVTLPKGVLAHLAGVPYCPDAVLAAAASKSGRDEQANPSCPAASQVGTVTIGAGAGPSPLYVTGKAYLAGPYKGAPLSLGIVTPAVAGPFDLGTVVVRAALNVNPETAQVTAVSDPIPSILQGIPLDVRSIAVNVDRPNFTLNPTNCSAQAVTGEALSLAGQSAPLSDRFQVGGCKGLAFKPTLKLAFTGRMRRAGYPAVKAMLTQPKGQNSNIAKASVILPKGMLIASAHINNPCTRVQFNSDPLPGEGCPANSILGTAKVWTPLLEKPEEGKVYFRSNGGERQLPDLVVALRGQIPVQLVGFIDSVGRKGAEVRRVRTRFFGIPDAPISRFELKLAGGKRGLLQNSKNLCKASDKATFDLSGQNGAAHDTEPKVQVDCGKGGKKGSAGKGKKK